MNISNEGTLDEFARAVHALLEQEGHDP
jgi:hypothetical protein